MKKKILLTFAVCALLSSSVLAEERSSQYYIKLAAGVNKLNKVTEKHDTVIVPQSSQFNLIGSIAFGYYVNNNFRTDINLGYDSIKFKDGSHHYKTLPNNIWGHVKRDGNIKSILVNGYADLPMNESINLFAGIGIGMAMIDEKLEYVFKSNNITGAKIHNDSSTNNFAYNIMLGANCNIYPSTKLEITYIWKDFGKTKAKKYEFAGVSDKTTAVSYKGHGITAGIRIDI